ncbi:MAG: hypothetical protein ACPGPB_00305 [Flavobacteriaceae bacterium]
MKNIVFNLMVLVLIFSIKSCGITEAGEINRQYQLMNASGVDIKITFYNTFSNTSFEAQIDKNGIFLGNVLTYRSGNDQWNYPNTHFPSSAFNKSDSLKIVFGNSKYLTCKYTVGDHPYEDVFSSPVGRNLFRNGNYEEIEKEKFQFKITQQDYDNAADCNGNCD